MKDQKTEDSQNILSIEEYRKKQITSQATATGEVLQTPSKKRDNPASILAFKQKQKTSSLNQTGYKGSSENIIYMKNYLKSIQVSEDTFKQEDSSSLQTFKEGNIVVMNEYLKRKIPEHMESSDWTSNMLPPRGSFQKWTAAVAVAVLVMVAIPFFNQGEKRGVAGEKAIPIEPVSDHGDFFEKNQEARRGLQSVPGNTSLSVNQFQSDMISAGRKPTKEEQLNGY
ncbi:MAG: hypothetical protein OXB86_01685 [Bdellovibrionales bacterium]|nr:hypothetical protein [Bdellovibrionales bacterium]